MTHVPLQLGFDNYTLRSLRWSAEQLIDYAATQKLDILLLSDLDAFGDRSDAHLGELRRRAVDAGIVLYAGTLSICPSSVIFDARRGTAEEQLRETIRVAKAVGSPVARCVLGKIEDRRSPGGIEARIDETVRVLKSVRSYAMDCGIKVAVENHAGDMQAHELLGLIEQSGRDFVGVTMDSGNATWALEDPAWNLELLGPHALCTGIRDSAVWDTPDGAAFEWTAMGQGSVDWENYFRRYAELCPATPVILEIISGRPFSVPYLTTEFWTAYERVSPAEFARFLTLARKGTPRQAPPEGRALDPQFQLAELEASIRYCRDVVGLGRRR